MDKSYITLQHNGYRLTIYNGITPLDPDNDNVDVRVTFPNGDNFSATFFTLQNIDTLMQHYTKTGECAAGSYFWASNMIIVQKLTEQTICEAIDDLLAAEKFTSIFSKNSEPTIVPPKDGEALFKRFDESLRAFGRKAQSFRFGI